jgi:hypothetical protein
VSSRLFFFFTRITEKKNSERDFVTASSLTAKRIGKHWKEIQFPLRENGCFSSRPRNLATSRATLLFKGCQGQNGPIFILFFGDFGWTTG